MSKRGRSNREERLVHAVDPDRHTVSPYNRTMCDKSISRRYTTHNSAGPVNCPGCRTAIGRAVEAVEADYYDDTTTGEMFDWDALLLPRGRRSP